MDCQVFDRKERKNTLSSVPSSGTNILIGLHRSDRDKRTLGVAGGKKRHFPELMVPMRFEVAPSQACEKPLFPVKHEALIHEKKSNLELRDSNGQKI